jgi:heterodisulfide reductase subunit C
VLLSIEFQARNGILEISEAAEKCFKCATCALVCPVTRYGEGYNPRETFVYDIFSSVKPAANQNIWSCALCHKCYEVCPQDVNPPKVIESLKEIAFEKGWAPPNVVALVESVIHTGRAFPITDATKRMRAQFNLPPLTSEGLDDLREIAENTGLEERLDKLESKKANENEQ